MSAQRWIGLTVVMALILALALWLREKPAQVDAPASAARPSVTSAAPANTPIKTPVRTVEKTADFGAARVEIERQAAAGDRAAAERLGKVMLTCDGYRDRSPEQIQAEIVDTLARFSASRQQALNTTLDAGSLALLLQTQFEKLREVCLGANELHLDATQRLQALAWARQAADAGSTAAMLTYAEHAFDEYSSPVDLIRSAEEVRLRKQVARAYLDRAAAAGDADVFALRASMHEIGGVLEKDPVAAYANYYAYAHSTVATPEAELMLRVYASAVSADDRQVAQQMAQQWLEQCCIETRLGP
jgi:TPR repeat protein